MNNVPEQLDKAIEHVSSTSVEELVTLKQEVKFQFELFNERLDTLIEEIKQRTAEEREKCRRFCASLIEAASTAGSLGDSFAAMKPVKINRDALVKIAEAASNGGGDKEHG